MGKISQIFGVLKNIELVKYFLNMRPKWFWLGFAAGVIYFSYNLFWLWGVYPLDFLPPIFWLWKIILIFFPFALTVSGMALFWGIFSWSASKFTQKLTKVPFAAKGTFVSFANSLTLPFVAAGGFVLAEYARAWFFGILWWGGESMLGAHWTFGNPAYLFSGIGPIFKTLSIWGIYGLDFWLIFTATALFLFLSSGKKIFLAELAAATAIIPILGIIQKQELSESAPKIPVSVIQTEYPTKFSRTAEETLDHFKQGLVMLKEAAKNMTDENGIIIFAEGADFSKTLSSFLDSVSVKTFFNGLSKKELLIVDSNQISESGKSKLKTVFVNSQKGATGYYDKQLLMPGTEFLPYLIKRPLFALRPSLKNDFANFQEFAQGTGSNILRYGNLWVKTMICSDALSPKLAGKGNFDFIIIQNGFGVLGGSEQLAGQMLAMTKARAVENSKDLVFASNFGRSYILNSSGNVAKMADNTGYKILTGEIVPRTVRTWYNKLGDWPILVLSLLFVSFAIFLKFFSRAHVKASP